MQEKFPSCLMTLPLLGCLPGTTTGKQLCMRKIDVINTKGCCWLQKVMCQTGNCCATTVRITRVRWWSATSCWRFTWGSSPLRSSSSTADSWQANCGSHHAIHCCKHTHTLELNNQGTHLLYGQEHKTIFLTLYRYIKNLVLMFRVSIIFILFRYASCDMLT